MGRRIEGRLSFEVEGSTDYAYDRRWKPPSNSLMFTCSGFRSGLLLMVIFAVSLLILPLYLPPLPPPPLLLLLIPVAIMAVLIFLAFTPPKLANVTSSSV